MRWIAKPDAATPAREGESDLVIVHPERGLLTLEVKGGRIRRDSQGRWYTGEHQLKRSPFAQAQDSHHTLADKLTSLPDWPGTRADLRTGHAVCLPDVAVHGPARRSVNLGPDAPLELVIDQGDLASADSAAGVMRVPSDQFLVER